MSEILLNTKAMYKVKITISIWKPCEDGDGFRIVPYISEGLFIPKKKTCTQKKIGELCIQKLKPIWEEAFPERTIDFQPRSIIRVPNDFFLIVEE
jgi:hypothetical protein